MIDTHTHIYMPDSFPDGEGALAAQRAFAAGVDTLIFPGINPDSAAQMLTLQTQYPEQIHIAVGLHPTELTDNFRAELATVEAQARANKIVAIGEIGIDLYWSAEHRDEQIEVFRHQVKLAAELSKPVIIHCREGLDEVLSVIAEFGGTYPPLLFHSFTYGVQEVRRIRALVPDAMFGINGVATFKSAKEVREAVAEIGINHILLETDSPYLAPVPFRGKRNESSFLPAVARLVADTLGLTEQEVDEITTASARRFFNIP